MRRLTRLEPPYILAMLFRIALLLTVMHKPLGMVLSHGAASLVYMHSLVFGDMSTVNPPAWSLEVEIQFYIMAPLLALTFFKLRPACSEAPRAGVHRCRRNSAALFLG